MRIIEMTKAQLFDTYINPFQNIIRGTLEKFTYKPVTDTTAKELQVVVNKVINEHFEGLLRSIDEDNTKIAIFPNEARDGFIVSPENLFTGLLMMGIYHPLAVGVDSVYLKHVKFEFKTKKVGQVYDHGYVEVIETLPEHPGVINLSGGAVKLKYVSIELGGAELLQISEENIVHGKRGEGFSLVTTWKEQRFSAHLPNDEARKLAEHILSVLNKK